MSTQKIDLRHAISPSAPRRKPTNIIRISRQYGFEYFDGPREYGYGVYRYDGRWVAIAQDMVAHWNLKPGDRVARYWPWNWCRSRSLRDHGLLHERSQFWDR
jgi:hypothetical protein